LGAAAFRQASLRSIPGSGKVGNGVSYFFGRRSTRNRPAEKAPSDPEILAANPPATTSIKDQTSAQGYYSGRHFSCRTAFPGPSTARSCARSIGLHRQLELPGDAPDLPGVAPGRP